MKLAIIGGGSWGTALAIVLAPRFEEIAVWVYEGDLAARMRSTRINDVYLPGLALPANVCVFSSLEPVLAGADIVLGVMPSHHARRVYSEALPFLGPQMIFVSATKGIERQTLLRMSQVMAGVLGNANIAVLSGPTFAREIARGDPAAVVIASRDHELAATIQRRFSGPTFRLYTNSDPIGVEIGAALKNVIAIGAGVCHGLGLGNNTLAALITRGLAEITRLAVAMGGQPKTLAGLAGLGDLVLTCSGELSRNRKVGLELAKGKTLAGIVASTPMIAEGIETCDAAFELGRKFHVDLPIVEQMHQVLHLAKSPRDALRDLMERSLKGE